MKSKRRRHDSEFKARVAFEALKGTKTLQELAKEYDLHPVQISRIGICFLPPGTISSAWTRER